MSTGDPYCPLHGFTPCRCEEIRRKTAMTDTPEPQLLTDDERLDATSRERMLAGEYFDREYERARLAQAEPSVPPFDAACRERLENFGGLCSSRHRRDIQAALAEIEKLKAERDALDRVVPANGVNGITVLDRMTALVAQWQSTQQLVDVWRAEVEAQAREIAEASAALDGYAAPDPDKPLAQRIRDELADFQMVIRHCAEIYCHVTDSRISKPNTLPSEVIAVADDLEAEHTWEAVAEETKKLRAKLSRVQARIAELEGR